MLDAATASVYRIDLAGQKATAIFREGNKAAGATQAAPRLLGVGGRDLLMVDARNVVWRWRPANNSGKGSYARVAHGGRVRVGRRRARDRHVHPEHRRQPLQLLHRRPVRAADQGLLARPRTAAASRTSRLLACPPRATSSGITDLYIDGDIWLADGGQLLRIVGGKSEGWDAASPGDEILRGEPTYVRLTSGAERREGTIYGLDEEADRVVALSKTNGAFIEQYRLGGESTAWSDMRGWYVEPGLDGEPDALVWASANALHRVVLEATTPPTASPGPDASSAASPAAAR